MRWDLDLAGYSSAGIFFAKAFCVCCVFKLGGLEYFYMKVVLMLFLFWGIVVSFGLP